MSIYLRLTGQPTANVEGAVVNRAFSTVAAVMIFFYQIRMEIKGYKSDKKVLTRIIAILMPVVILWISFYSTASKHNTLTMPVQAQITGVIVLFTLSVILPMMFIWSHANMKQFVIHKIFLPSPQDPPVCLGGLV